MLVRSDEVGDRKFHELGAILAIDINISQAVGALYNDGVLADDEVEAVVILECHHVLLRSYAFAVHLAHLDKKCKPGSLALTRMAVGRDRLSEEVTEVFIGRRRTNSNAYG